MRNGSQVAGVLLLVCVASAADSWSQLWLHTSPVSAAYASKLQVPQVVCPQHGPVMKRACTEFVNGLKGMLGKAPDVVTEITMDNAIVLEADTRTDEMVWPPSTAKDAYHIEATERSHKKCTVVKADSSSGVLFGVFRLLHLIRTEQPMVLSKSMSVQSEPSSPLRMWDLWDNEDRTVERGYAGKSVFYFDQLPSLLPRYTDYARLLASVGINAIVWDNVNACGHGNKMFLETSFSRSFAPLAELFAEFGIWTFFVPCFSDPIGIGKLKTADPLDKSVVKWWTDKASEMKSTIPSFRGFLVKADTEGEPGPATYHRTELEGANMFGNVLASQDSIVIWRCFAHPPKGQDQALFQYNLFHSWDGKFLPNVVLQAKNGPFDFQVREPVHSLFGRMPNTNFILEFQATQEYLGEAKHLAHLPAQWEYYLNWNIGFQGNVSLGQFISGRSTNQTFTGIAAVSNLGDDANWAGHEMSAANTYGFGRLAWDPLASARTVTKEWVEATWGLDSLAVSTVTDMLLDSWEAYENYTAPLGVGFICDGNHYAMNPEHRQDYINASTSHVGYNRWLGFGKTYLPSVAAQLGSSSPSDCPDNLLLCFHNVPYDYPLASKGNLSVIEYIYESHNSGASSAASFVSKWASLKGRIDESSYGVGVFDAVSSRLEKGAADARVFADAVIKFFYSHSGKKPPGPAPGPAPSPVKGFVKHAGHYWSTSKGSGTRTFSGASSSAAECAAKCLGDSECSHFDFRSRENTCRTYSGVPALLSSSNGYDAYEKEQHTSSLHALWV